MTSSITRFCINSRRCSINRSIYNVNRFKSTLSTDISKSAADDHVTTVSQTTPNFLKRFSVTAEVTLSKIFPAGFGWQAGAIYASSLDISSSSLSFALFTGVGDLAGVTIGHFFYYLLKKSIDPSIDIMKEAHTAFFLGSAAFCSGFVWQPAVNALQAAGTLPFSSVMLGAWAAGTIAFFSGLRVARTIYSPYLYVAAGSDKNFRDDVMLSASIGGAAAGFVGTDTVYLSGEGNHLKSLVGVIESDSAITQMIKAGESTSVGFVIAQTAQNITNGKGKNWTD